MKNYIWHAFYLCFGPSYVNSMDSLARELDLDIQHHSQSMVNKAGGGFLDSYRAALNDFLKDTYRALLAKGFSVEQGARKHATFEKIYSLSYEYSQATKWTATGVLLI